MGYMRYQASNKFALIERATRDVHAATLLLARARAQLGRAQCQLPGDSHADDMADLADYSVGNALDSAKTAERHLKDMYDAMPDPDSINDGSDDRSMRDWHHSRLGVE